MYIYIAIACGKKLKLIIKDVKLLINRLSDLHQRIVGPFSL